MNVKRTMSGKEVFFSLAGMALFIWLMAETGGFGGIYNAVMPEQIPRTLKQAGLVNKKWNGEDAKLAAKITVNTLQRLDAVIFDADRRGDYPAATQTFDEFSTLTRGWSDQHDNAVIDKFRNCLLATVHAMDGATSVAQGGHYLSRGRFNAALDACRSAI